jgi:hypothetical protein
MTDEKEDREEVVDTRREALEAAMREAEENAPQETQEAAETPEEAPEAAPAADAALPEADAIEEADEGQPAEEATPWAEPPSSWKKEHREAWANVDSKVKEYIWQREDEMRKGVETLIPKAKFADTISTVMQPYMETIKGMGAEPHQAVEALMKADHALRYAAPDQKKAYFLELAKSYNISLSEDDMKTVTAVPEQFSQVQNELLSVKATIADLKREREENEARTIKQQIDAFAKDSPYFNEVQGTMAELLKNGLANDLADAYNKAIRLDDSVFAEVQKGQQTRLDKEKRESANRAAQAAKAAAVSVKSSTPGVRTPAKAQDRRSVLLEQFSEMDGRL